MEMDWICVICWTHVFKAEVATQVIKELVLYREYKLLPEELERTCLV